MASAGLWAIYLRFRLGWTQSVSQVQEIGLPFRGLAKAFAGWIGDPMNLVVGITVMLVLVLFTRRALRSDHLVGWAFVGFAVLAAVFTEQVWRSYFDITRAIAPLITAFVLLVFMPPSPTTARARSIVGSSELPR